jgi:RNA polymerase sigma-70 factor, ECF subfamily
MDLALSYTIPTRWKLNSSSSGSSLVRSGERLSVRSTDTSLVEATVSGDEHAFRLLVQRFQPMVLKIVRGMLGEAMDVDDVVQETFVRLYTALPRFRSDSTLKTFVTRIAINGSLDSLRRRKRRFFVSWDVEKTDGDPQAVERSDTALLRSEQWTHLRTAIDRLAPRQKAVVVLRLVNGLSTKETAEALEIPFGTVLSRLNRAIARLRVDLRPELDTES